MDAPPVEKRTSTSFHRRLLPESCIDFASPEGKKLFREALDAGHMEGFFPLAAQFHTQSEPAYCGLGTLAMVLNALNIDPGRTWKGVWRWYSEELLDCCKPLEMVIKEGIIFSEFVCLAKCNSAHVEAFYASEADIDTFRDIVLKATTRGEEFVVVSYNRQVFSQTGTGHYSPIGGYCPERDMVLIMDVARFKYPPHWVPLPLAFKAMQDIDKDSGKSRGFAVLSTKHSRIVPSVLCRMLPRYGNECSLTPQDAGALLHGLFSNLRKHVAKAESVNSVVEYAVAQLMSSTLRHIFHSVEKVEGLSSGHKEVVEGLRAEIKASKLNAIVQTMFRGDHALFGELNIPLDVLVVVLYAIPLDALAAEAEGASPAVVSGLQHIYASIKGTTYLVGEAMTLNGALSALKEAAGASCCCKKE